MTIQQQPIAKTTMSSSDNNPNHKQARTKALFDRAVAAIASLPSTASTASSPNQAISLSNQQLLHFYSLYKQATVGDLPTASLRRPGLFDLRGRAKYDAWLAMQGTPQHVAMRQYVDLFMSFLQKFPDRPIAQELLAEFVNEGALASPVASSVSRVQSASSASDESQSESDGDGDDKDNARLRHQDVRDRARAPIGQPSATTRRRASIATLETDAGGSSFYSASAAADDSLSDSQHYSSSDTDDDGSETASETMVTSAPDTLVISPGPVPKPATAHHQHQHHHHHPASGSSSSTTSIHTAFFRPDDTRSVTSVATVRPPPPPRSPPPVASELARSWVAADRSPAGSRGDLPGPSSRPGAPAAPMASRDFTTVSPSKLAGESSGPANDPAHVAVLQAHIARLEAQLATTRPTTSKAQWEKPMVVRALRASGGWIARWLMRSLVAWILLATVGREMRRRKSNVYLVLEWLVKVAVGVEAVL